MKNKKGFTLIELLVVIAIIGLLSTLSVVSLNNARARARDARRVADVKQIQTALELYYNANNSYPTQTTPASATTSLTGNSTLTPYMNPIPEAPTPEEAGCANKNDYMYQSGGTSTYILTYCLGSDTGGIPAGHRQATQSSINAGVAP